MNKLHPSVVVLKAMLLGRFIKLKHSNDFLGYQDGSIVYLYKIEMGEPVVLPAQIKLDRFVKECELIPEDEIADLNEYVALNDEG